MPRCYQPTLLFAVLFALAACRSAPLPAAPEPLACTLVLLKTGPRTEPLTKEENAKVFGGHFANMGRLANEGLLLVAGPYGEHRSDAALRGLFVLATADRAHARQLAESDPTFAAGVFRFEFHDLTTGAALRAHLADELAVRAAAEREGKQLKPGESGRVYVLLTAANGVATEAAIAGNPAVLMQARLDGTQSFMLLDARDLTAANALLAPVAARIGPYVLDEWFSSGGLAKLPQRT